MQSLVDYELRDQIHESRRTIVYRGRRRSDDRPVIVKTHRADRPPPAAIARLRHEYGVGAALSGPSIIEYLAVEAQGHSVAVVTEDFGGVDLRACMPSLRGDLEAFLAMALQLTDALALVHDRGVIHRDLKPANIVANAQTGVVKLIDFGLASKIVRERREPTNPAGMVGTLLYMSPEQTGRMNRPIDHRTDLYSLGVTFYEMLCGQPPFTSIDPLELIHSHIAKPVVPLHQLDPGIPRVLSEVVTKLLAKNAEDRYQTARGLHADLLRCQAQLGSTRPHEVFALGAHDRAETLQLSQRMYGRGPQRERLLAAFDRVAAGGRELALIRGSAGIGKSSLVAEVHRPMTKARGYFIRGKCDPLQRNTPYTPLLEAFRSLLRELLTESEKSLVRWRERLGEALGQNAPLIVEVLPELRLLIGEQPVPTEVGPAEARRRFDRTFLRFVEVFAHREHPLVVVLDDLQWVDSGTLRILSQVLTSSDCTHLLVVGAYRGEEVDAAHPLVTTLGSLRAAGVRSDELELGMLELADVTALVADTLGCTTDVARPLATLVHGKTEGNPFFIGELLRSLNDDGLLTLGEQGWTWDIAAIEAQGVSTSVVALLVDKVRLLPEDTQQILRIAASMGSAFSLGLLRQVLDWPLEVVSHGLREAVRGGLVQPLDDLYQQADLGMSGGEDARYRFAHDRIQEAAYSLLPAPERPAVHWRVGQLLLERTPPEQREAHVFDIVNQLDPTLALGRPPAERVELARLELLAGQRAAAAAAHEQALVYLRRGIELLGGEDGFESEPALALQLHVGACGSAQLSGDLDAMSRFAEVALAKAPSAIDRVPIHEIEIRAHTAQGRLPESLALGLRVLASFGIHFPEEPGLAEFQHEVGALVARLADCNADELAQRPRMVDATMRAMMRMLMAISVPAFTTKPMLFPGITRRLIELTLEHGSAPESAVGYAQYGMLCCIVLGDYQGGQRFGELAQAVVERLDARWILPRVESMVGLIRPWSGPLLATCGPLREASRLAMENGDPEWAGHCIQIYGVNALFGSSELEELLVEMNAHVEALDRAGQHASATWINIQLQMMHNLMGYTQAPTRLQGAVYDERQMLPLHEAHGDLIARLHLSIDTTILSYLFRDYERALEYADRTEAFLPVGSGQIQVPLYYFYDSLVRLAVVEKAPASQRDELLARVEANQAKLEVWAQSAPTNHRHKWKLVEAERHRVAGRLAEALDAYDEAIVLATRHGYANEAALANERASELWRARGNLNLAQAYASVAHYDYARWGARAKLADLEARYPQLRLVDTGSSSDSSSVGGEPLSESERLDMGSVFKATRIISEEMELDRAVTKLMTIVIENAGARRGLLLLEEAGELRIQAAGSVTDDAVVVERPSSGQSGALGTLVSEAIVRFVSRTREPVVLHDAPREGSFTRDPYVMRSGVRSVLCMPFSTPSMRKEAAMGVLYLENADAVGAFTHDRVRVLKLITAQAAISLENARLYGDLKTINARLEELVEERTQELRQAQQALIRASRKAGQAEVAENLLHNAGNTLNRLTVAMGTLHQAIELPPTRVLRQTVARLDSPEHELAGHLAAHERGPLLVKLLASISKQLDEGKDRLYELAGDMSDVVEEFVQVLAQHDEMVEASMVLESFPLGPLLDDAIASAGTATQPGVLLVRRYGHEPVVATDRYRLERLVVGLLRDLHERMGESEATLTVASTSHEGQVGRVRIVVGLGDHGEARQLRAELFRQQRISHPDAPTLHDCANAARTLGAVLDGFRGRTARDVHFVLTLDISAADRRSAQ